ncbi:MAG TPA: metallophosphoesterase family protein [bacterium]|nr:metallophosphoesterase family protein [bacterium]
MMTTCAAVLADVHGNQAALAAVLRAVDAGGYGPLYCLGDIVGYGPDPGWCVRELRRRNCASVLGNHDVVACGLRPADDFSPPAQKAIAWTRTVMTAEEQALLAALPTRREVPTPTGNALLVHGNLVDDYVTYLTTPAAAAQSLALLTAGRYAFFGHTHRPLIWQPAADGTPGDAAASEVPVDDWYVIPDRPVLLNPGSVGQPRDHDPRAAFVVWDIANRRCRWERVPYDIAATQGQMAAAGLPAFLSERLAQGR